jgi:hypothetical protein
MRTIRRVDVLVSIFALILVSGFLLPIIFGKRPHQISSKRQCHYNLSRINLMLSMFASDHNDEFPMHIAAANEGSEKYTNAPQTFKYFAALIPYLDPQDASEPASKQALKVFICPSDSRKAALPSKFNNQSLSYFISLDARPDNPGTFLLGDRNLTNMDGVQNGILFQSPNSPLAWAEGLHSRRLGYGYGLIATAGGGTQGYDQKELKATGAASPMKRNRLSFPE